MSVLVTGASGFVGAAVTRRLLAEGLAVRVLARPGSDPRNLKGLDIEIVRGDLTDAQSLKAACRGIEALFHVAADYRFWVRDPAPMYAANVEGSRGLLRIAAEAGARRIVYTSSVAVLGLKKDGGVSDESAPAALADMIGPYKRSKFLAEETVRGLVREEGVPAVIVNPSAPMGPRDVKPTPTGRIVVDFARGRMPAYVDTGLNVVHVEDCAEGHWLAFKRGAVGERYILGGDNITLAEILAILARLTGRKPPGLRIPHAALPPLALLFEGLGRLGALSPPLTRDTAAMARKKMFFTSAKAEAALGYRHRPAARAIEDALAWFRAEGYLDG